MNCYKYLTTVVVTLAWALTKNECDASIRIQWDKPVYLCGSALSRYTRYFCLYNGNDMDYADIIPIFPETKRIVERCCHVPCTARFIYENYCVKQNFDLSKDLILPSTTTSTTTRTITKITTTTPAPWYSFFSKTFGHFKDSQGFGYPIRG